MVLNFFFLELPLAILTFKAQQNIQDNQNEVNPGNQQEPGLSYRRQQVIQAEAENCPLI